MCFWNYRRGPLSSPLHFHPWHGIHAWLIVLPKIDRFPISVMYCRSFRGLPPFLGSPLTGFCWSDVAWNWWLLLFYPRWLWSTAPSSTTRWTSRTAPTFPRPSVPTRKIPLLLLLLTSDTEYMQSFTVLELRPCDCGETSGIKANHARMYILSIYDLSVCVSTLCSSPPRLCLDWILQLIISNMICAASQFVWVVNLQICI